MHFDTIYCDLDDVLGDFGLEALRAHMKAGKRLPVNVQNPLELTHEHVRKILPPGITVSHYICPEAGNETDFWAPVFDSFWEPIRRDPMFWHGIVPFPWTAELVKMLQKNCRHLIYVTTPDKHHHSYGGKYSWLLKHELPMHDVITIREKERLACPDSLLIDDKYSHIKAWNAKCQDRYGREGRALLFPASWNHNHGIRDPLGFVRRYLMTPD